MNKLNFNFVLHCFALTIDRDGSIVWLPYKNKNNAAESEESYLLFTNKPKVDKLINFVERNKTKNTHKFIIFSAIRSE